MAILGRALLQRISRARRSLLAAVLQDRQAHAAHAITACCKSFEGADGMKTGFICASGFNVVASATRGDRRILAVVLGEEFGRRADGAAPPSSSSTASTITNGRRCSPPGWTSSRSTRPRTRRQAICAWWCASHARSASAGRRAPRPSPPPPDGPGRQGATGPAQDLRPASAYLPALDLSILYASPQPS